METKYFLIINGSQVGPLDYAELREAGLTIDTPVWREGLPDWVKASQLPELAGALSSQPAPPPHPMGQFARAAQPNGQFGRAPYEQPYNPDNGYNNLPIAHTNWLPWAIVGTVLGVLFCFIGMIFGIIGIVNANKANNAYNIGDGETGAAVNKNARTMTIISLILGGLGVPISLLVLTGLLADMANMSQMI
ncbi:MAG: DUF4339 domain-containing protein [Muribaculaceae bacterium]|nr:DUF4339 domain-containing protein [Muribaculaceae bacterium]